MTAPARVLVTGATSGIGLAVTEALLNEGVSVVAVGRNLASLDGLVERFPEHLETLRANLADPADVRLVVPRARASGPLGGFVSAAGIAHHAPLGAIAEASFREQFEVNVFAPMRLGEALVETLESGGGMVFVASNLAHRPLPSSYVYSATKSALLSAVRSLALAGAPRGVRVNAVSPGVVDTPMARQARDADGDRDPRAIERRMEALSALHPLGRVGTASEVANGIVQLLRAPWTTGAELIVDGGLSLA